MKESVPRFCAASFRCSPSSTGSTYLLRTSVQLEESLSDPTVGICKIFNVHDSKVYEEYPTGSNRRRYVFSTDRLGTS